MSIRPNITLLFILSVLTVLLVIAIIFPEKGIAITDNTTLKFITPGELLTRDNQGYADITNIIKWQSDRGSPIREGMLKEAFDNVFNNPNTPLEYE